MQGTTAVRHLYFDDLFRDDGAKGEIAGRIVSVTAGDNDLLTAPQLVASRGTARVTATRTRWDTQKKSSI